MTINIKDILTLDDNNEYVVVNKIFYDSKNYYYPADLNNNTNVKSCYVDKDELVEINDKALNTKLLSLFANSSKNIID